MQRVVRGDVCADFYCGSAAADPMGDRELGPFRNYALKAVFAKLVVLILSR